MRHVRAGHERSPDMDHTTLWHAPGCIDPSQGSLLGNEIAAAFQQAQPIAWREDWLRECYLIEIKVRIGCW